MGHKLDENSQRQRRARLPRCAFCGKRSSVLTHDPQTDSLRHRGCFGKVATPPAQPETILEAYRTPIMQLNDRWRAELRAFSEFRELNASMSLERSAELWVCISTSEW